MTGGLMYNDQFLRHQPSLAHPECPDRLVSIWGRLTDAGIVSANRLVEARPATKEELHLIHSRDYVKETLKQIEGTYGFLDGDTYFSPGSMEAALLAVGGTIDLAGAVYKGSLDWGLALPRPPGHHATRSRAMGFCIFNNIAAAAASLLEAGAKRILIFDWDVHHGNGTQDIFFDDPRVLLVSVHQWPHFPGTGLWDEVGEGDGKGYTVNVPFPPGASDGDYAAVAERILAPLAEAFAPDIVLVSAGFDAYERDMLAGMRVTVDGFAYLAEAVRKIAEPTGRGPCLVLEGGYHLDGIAKATEAVVRVLEGEPAPSISKMRSNGCMEVIDAAIDALEPHWSCF
jgi:acetoin utilization deacetylase AcuC-like enzyme